MNKGACEGCISLRFGEVEINPASHFTSWQCDKLGKLFGTIKDVQEKFPAKCAIRKGL